MFDFLKRLFNPATEHVEKLASEFEASVTEKTSVVRDGVAYTFLKHKSGLTTVHAARRTKPYKRAVFQIEDQAAAVAWRDDGVIPSGEVSDLVRQFQAGTWPEKLRSTSRPF